MSKLCSAVLLTKKLIFNSDTQTQLWMSQLADAHDNFCNCNCPFAHLLATIFPPGHQDRDRTINQILKRDYIEQCLSSGKEEKGGGIPDGEAGAGNSTGLAEEIDFIKDEELTEAAAAVDDAERR